MPNYLSLFTLKIFDPSSWTGLKVFGFTFKGEISLAAEMGTLILGLHLLNLHQWFFVPVASHPYNEYSKRCSVCISGHTPYAKGHPAAMHKINHHGTGSMPCTMHWSVQLRCLGPLSIHSPSKTSPGLVTATL